MIIVPQFNLDLPSTPVNQWVDLDLSPWLPASASGVQLRFFNAASGGSGLKLIGARKKGSTDDSAIKMDLDDGDRHYVLTGVDGDGVCQIFRETDDIRVWLEFIFESSEAVFFDDVVDVTPASFSSWEDVDISGETGSDTATAALCGFSPGSQGQVGLRQNGSSDNRVGDTQGGTAFRDAVIGCDGSEIFEAYIEDTGTSLLLRGYMKANFTAIDPGVDYSPSTGPFQHVDFTPDIPQGNSIALVELRTTADTGFTELTGFIRNDLERYLGDFNTITYATYYLQDVGELRKLETNFSGSDGVELWLLGYVGGDQRGEAYIDLVSFSNTDLGGPAWSNPGNAESSDDSYATCTPDGSASDGLDCQELAESMPSNARIDGIGVKVEFNHSQSLIFQVSPLEVQLLDNTGSPVGEQVSLTSTNTSDQEYDFMHEQPPPALHGHYDLWGINDEITPAYVNDADFGVRITGSGGSSDQLSVDQVQMRFRYTLPFAGQVLTAWKLPGTQAQDSDGDITWTLNASNNITDRDGQPATHTADTSAAAVMNTIKATNFGFSLPDGAEIEGVWAKVIRSAENGSGGGVVNDVSVQLIKGGTISGDNRRAGLGSKYQLDADSDGDSNWPAAGISDPPLIEEYGEQLYGGNSDLWGLTLTKSDVEASNFGVAVQAEWSGGGGASMKLFIESIEMSVAYKVPKGGAYIVNRIGI